MDRAVRVGVLGLRRGAALARLARQAGMQVVAVCERDDRRRAAAASGAVAYRDVEPFLEHEMDAVILVNDFEAGQQAWVRLHGDRGLMENLRHGDTRTLRVVWDLEEGEDQRRTEEVYLPWPPELPATDADPMGDGVAELLMLRDFASAVRHEQALDQDVHVGVGLSIAGIQAMRSSLAGNLPVEIPDLRYPEVRRTFAADDWFPDLPEL